MVRSLNLDTVAPDDEVVKKTEEVKNEPEVKKVSEAKSEPVDPMLRQRIYNLLGHTKSSLSAFLIKPHVFSFQERDDEEEIILVMRPHWITNIPWIFTSILMFMAPSFLKYVPLFSGVSFRYQIVGFMFWYMISFAFLFEKFLSWYFNVFIITDERIVDIDFNNLLNRKFSEAKISMIQDVTSRITGVAQTLFNYGNIVIQTAAEINQIVFEKIPNPEKVIKVLQMLRQEEEKEALAGRTR